MLYRFKKTNKSDIIGIKKSNEPNPKKTVSKTKCNNAKQSKKRNGYIGMNKQAMKNTIQSLTAGDNLTVNFVGPKAGQSGTFKVLGKKTGRGKGGSLLVELEAPDGSTLTTGTPESNVILNMITSDGNLIGFKNETDLPRLYTIDTTRAIVLKEQLKTLLDAEGDVTVDIESSEPEYSGAWTVTGARKSRGRYGQVVLSLDNGKQKREFWSYRHSGIVSRITINR